MKPARPVTFDHLEARRLLTAAVLATSTSAYAGGQMLKIAGTAGNDTINLSYADGTYTLTTAAGFTKTLTGTYTAISVHGNAGNDKVTIDASVTTPTWLYGDAGNDTLSGGSGDDHVIGGAGNNTLSGNAGRDTIIALGGGTADQLYGGDGEDFFWADSQATEKVNNADAFETAHTVNRVSSFATSTFVTGTKTQAVTKEVSAPRFRDPDAAHGYVYKSFATNPLFSDAGPADADVRQGQVGDCYFLSTLAGVAAVSPEAVRDTVTDLGDGTYAVRFKSGAAFKYVRVDNDFATFGASSTTPAYAGFGVSGSVWVAVLEKAWCFARRNQGTYGSISGGWMGEVFNALNATNQESTWNSSNATGDQFLDWVQQRLAAGEVVTAGILTGHDDLNLIGGHAYTVTAITTAADGTRQLVLRNPWGVDGYHTNDGANDGYVTVGVNDALRGIDAFVAAMAA